MVTTWPPNFPGQGTGANTLARYIGELSNGRLTVDVYGAGELIPAFEIFDAVSLGAAELGHGAAYYWRGKTEAAQFFASIPFGMTAHEMMSTVTAWHATRTMAWRSSGSVFQASRFTMHSSVGPGSCQPG